MVWTLLLEAPTLRKTLAAHAALRRVTPVTALTHETHHICGPRSAYPLGT